MNWDNYDEVHVVSDLHLGGEGDFQIFDATQELVTLIDEISAKSNELNIGLVINGDFVDFLAEEDASTFNPVTAVTMLQRIVEDNKFKPVWQALSQFLNKENRRLVIVIGNHDIELTLPWVQDELLKLLTNNDSVKRARVRLVMEKGGYLCTVDGHKVLCTHGNEVDPWNVIDYKKISDLTSDMVQGRTMASWKPNAGSRMVIEVMNEVKKTRPFIDLFKPETEGAVKALLFLDSSQLKRFKTIAKIFSRKVRDEKRMKDGLLASDETQNINDISDANLDMMDGDDIWDYVENRVETTDDSAIDLLDADDEAFLGTGMAIVKSIFGASKGAVLKEALEPLIDDDTFKIDKKDDTFRDMDDRVGNDIKFLITGHTHLRRALPRKHGGGYYFNTGTWVRVLRLDKEVLSSDKKMDDVVKAFESGELSELDKFLMKKYTVASIFKKDGKVIGRLSDVSIKNEKLAYDDQETFEV